MFISNVHIENTVNHDFNSTNFYCYLLKDPKTNEVFYIGKGKQRRIESHKFPSTSHNNHKNNKIKNILKESGYFIAEIVYTSNNEQTAYIQEVNLINQYDKLTNIAPGGCNAPSKPCTPINQYNIFGEYIQTFSSCYEAAKSIDNREFTSKQILECCRGFVATCRNFYWSYENSPILKYRTKILPVHQLTLNNQYITRYSSLNEAGKCLGFDGRDIGEAIRRNGSAHGYKWKYHIFNK